MESSKERVSRDWPKLGLVAAAVVALYVPVLRKLVHDWWHNPNFSHGFLIPPLSAFLTWERREKLAAVALRPSNWGLLGAIGAVGLLFIGSLGAELFLTRLSLVTLLAGLVVFFLGWQQLRLLIFPLVVLLLMIPLPQVIFNQVAFPLQLAASKLAGSCLGSAGIPVLREGNLIVLPNNVTLEVVEACSGIRSLMALLALGVAYGHFFERSITIRWILVAGTAPIAIVANGLRIAGTGVLTYFLGEETAEGFFHLFSGWVVFLCAFLLLVALHKLVGVSGRMFRRGDTQ